MNFRKKGAIITLLPKSSKKLPECVAFRLDYVDNEQWCFTRLNNKNMFRCSNMAHFYSNMENHGL